MRWPRPRSQTEGLGTPASRGSCASWWGTGRGTDRRTRRPSFRDSIAERPCPRNSIAPVSASPRRGARELRRPVRDEREFRHEEKRRLCGEIRTAPGAVPEVQDVHHACGSVAGVENEVGRQWHLANPPPRVVIRVALGQRRESERPLDEFSPSRGAGRGSSWAMNSTISRRSASALSVIRTWQSIPESSSARPQSVAPDRLRHRAIRGRARLPVALPPARVPSRTVPR